ncbi:hypothetical protein B0H13DRAFT_2325648 [Mycena leptocephala]|nr:hypothetical protein B0H13DRAFT_2325648 [Mycena leptocephala]
MLALIPVVLAVQTVFAATSPMVSLLTRQALTPSSDCVSACTPLEDATIAADGSIAKLCTSEIINDYVKCYDCMISAAAITSTVAQEAVDGIVSGCDAVGFPVSGASVSGGSSGGVVGTETISLPSGTGTTTAGGSTSTGTAAGSSGDSSSSSSSSSSDSNSSGSGISGSGFKTSGAVRANAGVLVLLFVSVLSALMMQNL